MIFLLESIFAFGRFLHIRFCIIYVILPHKHTVIMIVDSFTKVMVSMFMAILIVIFTGLYT